MGPVHVSMQVTQHYEDWVLKLSFNNSQIIKLSKPYSCKRIANEINLTLNESNSATLFFVNV